MDYPVHEPRCGMGTYRDPVEPEVEEKMTTVTVTISTAITIAKVRKAAIPRWKA